MTLKSDVEPEASHGAPSDLRSRLLSDLAVSEQRLALAGISTAVLEAGEGPPVVLLHEPGGFAAQWLQVLPEIASSHRVIAPDLPGHGASDIGDAELDAERVLAWLSELIARTCASPPALVGHLGSGAIAARLAIAQPRSLRSLVLVDSFGLGRFRPAPRFALALFRYVARPTPRTYAGLMSHCTVDFASVCAGLGERWEPFQSYTLDRARSPDGKAALRVMMRELAVPAIPPAKLERIAVPVTLIWGRHDPVNRLPVAKAASERYGWPLEVIEEAGDDPPLEQPQAFLRAVRPAFAPFVDSADANGLYDMAGKHVYSEPIEERDE
jgi:pimeloyl-ACP methyl ester carboxylesterase